MVQEKDPSRQVKRVQCPRSVEGSRQRSEITKDADRKTGGPRYLLWQQYSRLTKQGTS